MLDKLLDPIFAPFRLLRSKVFQVQQLPATLKGEVSRAKAEVGAVKGDFKGYASSAKDAQGKAKGLAGKAGQVQVPKKKGWSLFGKKVACESCGQKLHPSWDECPYCGWKKGTPA